MNLEEHLLKLFRASTGASDTDLTDRTITESITAIGIPEKQEDCQAFVDKYTPMFNSFAGQTRNIVATHVKAVGELEEKIKEFDKKEPMREPQKTGEPESNEELETLRKELNEIKEEFNSYRTGNQATFAKKNLENYAKGLGYNDSYVLEKALDKIDFSKESDESVLQEALTTAYTEEFKKCRSTEPNFGGGSGDNKAETVVTSFLAKKAKKIEEDKAKYGK